MGLWWEDRADYYRDRASLKEEFGVMAIIYYVQTCALILAHADFSMTLKTHDVPNAIESGGHLASMKILRTVKLGGKRPLSDEATYSVLENSRPWWNGLRNHGLRWGSWDKRTRNMWRATVPGPSTGRKVGWKNTPFVSTTGIALAL